jgi:ABC-type transporter MlaC component
MKKIVLAFTITMITMAAQTQEKKEPTPQQALTGTCNAEAKNTKGDDRKKFMAECLKK